MEHNCCTIALAGNPNVGKSTVFNALTGMRQHTGNWPGKTVEYAVGTCSCQDTVCEIIDLPGVYSLMTHSGEEEVARDFLLFQNPDVVLAVCDATCLERNLNLVLQISEICPNLVLCVNLMDEAKKKQIHVDLKRLSEVLGMPVAGTAARNKKGLDYLQSCLLAGRRKQCQRLVTYPERLEQCIAVLETFMEKTGIALGHERWLAVRLLEVDGGSEKVLKTQFCQDELSWKQLLDLTEKTGLYLETEGYTKEGIRDIVAGTFVRKAEEISSMTVIYRDLHYTEKDRRLDQIFTSKVTGFPIMLLLLMGIFWLTISGANIPSEYLSRVLFSLEEFLVQKAMDFNLPPILYEPLLFGIYRVLAWVVSVMLPPMMIFFPVFTLMEDFGYLPRIAFNMDYCFSKCRTCGKQALTMCMGVGCNAVGVTGCRIIDSKRERLIAILTNSFVPCNGKFPSLIALISMFFLGGTTGIFGSFKSALLLALAIGFAVAMTLFVSFLLSHTLLKGIPSSFALELPPYRRPQVGRVIVRSVLDRAGFVLIRAVKIAAPFGLLIWVLGNLTWNGSSLLHLGAAFLDPFGKMLGMDGVILLAFLLGLPANEIVLPIMLMIYLSTGHITEIGNLQVLKNLLIDQGWTTATAVSTILFSLMHWPCGTTILTIRKETGNWKWTLAAVLLPTAAGILVCGGLHCLLLVLGL